MINAIFGAMTALHASATLSNITANNIANVKTPSYKSKSAFLSELSSGGVKLKDIKVNNNYGRLIPTGIASDIAVFGKGNENELLGIYNNVAKKFSVDDFGNLRGPAGELLFTGAGGNVRLDSNGNIYNDEKLLGTIYPADNNNQNDMITGYKILSGYIMSSNVNIAEEMVNNIINKSFFEINTLTIKTSDEMLGTVVNLKA